MVDASKLHTLEPLFYPGGDEPKPETNKNYLRLYGHNLCPFVARARNALALKGIPFQEVHVDLNNKAKWHLDLNGGFVPILELQNGEVIIESAIVATFAEEFAKDSGAHLIPADPLAAAKMRVEMTKFDPTMNAVWGMVMARYTDDAKTQAFKEQTLPKWEALATQTGGGWLSGTPEPNMLDVHVASMWDCIYAPLTNEGEIFTHVRGLTDVTNTAPNWVAYVERFRAHVQLNKYRFRKLAVEKHGIRSAGWPKDQKC
jgi:glutathione S-transferase